MLKRAARDLSRVSEEIALYRQEKMATEGEKVEKEKVLPKDAQVRLHIFNERQTPKDTAHLVHITWNVLDNANLGDGGYTEGHGYQ